jgi:hypothetical protein
MELYIKIVFIFCLKEISFQNNEINCMCMYVQVDVWTLSVFHDPKKVKSYWYNVKSSTSWGFLKKNKHGRWKCAKCWYYKLKLGTKFNVALVFNYEDPKYNKIFMNSTHIKLVSKFSYCTVSDVWWVCCKTFTKAWWVNYGLICFALFILYIFCTIVLFEEMWKLKQVSMSCSLLYFSEGVGQYFVQGV